MAHRFAYKPTGITLTCTLNDEWGIHVDGVFVDVRLTAPGGIIVLQERYYAHGGNVFLYDIGSLIECNMRSAAYNYADYTLALLNEGGTVADSCVIHALYCDRFTVCTDTDLFLAENFLSTLTMRRVPANTIISLFLFAKAGENIHTKVKFHVRYIPTGVIQCDSININASSASAASAGVQQVNISQSAMIRPVATSTQTADYLWEIVDFTVTCGQRSVTCFVDRTLRDADCFMFRNCFNVWDVAHIPHFTTAKTEVDRTLAVINQRSQFYNQSTKKTYEVQSGTITSDEAEWIDQLFTSYEVMRFVPNDCDDTEPYLFEQVLITDAHCEVNDGDEKPNTVKFTWRYADNRAIVRLTASPGIFTQEYDLRFS